MSEAMSSVEIEDVLSSIRRLVSDDLRPISRPSEPKKANGKLILTAAFRVVPEDAPPATPLPRLHLGADPQIEKRAATLERAVEAQDAEWESEVGDPAPHVSKMEWTESGWATVAEDAAPASAPPRPPEVPPSWAQSEPDPPEPAMSAPPKPLFAEPDTLWADQAEAEAVADLRAEQQAPVTTSNTAVALDEHVLRDLVRDLIREELQGDMGERITRNVRKLVRAEIARVLATQELD